MSIDQIEKQNSIKELQQNSNQRGSGQGNESWRRTSKNQLFRSEFRLQNGANTTFDDDSVIAATVEGFLQPPPGSVYDEQGGKCRFRIKLDYTYNPAIKGRSSLSSLNGLSFDSLAEALQVDRSNLPENYQLDILSKLKPMLHGLTEVLAGESGVYACPSDLPESQGAVSASVTSARKSIPERLSIGKSKRSSHNLPLHHASINDAADEATHKTSEFDDQPSTLATRGMHTTFKDSNMDRTKSSDAYVLVAEVSTISEQYSAETTDPHLMAAVKPLTASIVTSAVEYLVLEDVVKSKQSVQERYRASHPAYLQDKTLTKGINRSTSTQAKPQSLASLGTTEEIMIVDDDFKVDDDETLKVDRTIECSKTDVAVTGLLSMPKPNAGGGAYLNKDWLNDVGFDEDSTMGGLDLSWSTLESVGVISITTASSRNSVTAIRDESNDDSLLLQVDTALINSPEHLDRPDSTSGRLGFLEGRQAVGTEGFHGGSVTKPLAAAHASSVVRPDDILFNIHMSPDGNSKEKSSVKLGFSMNFGRPGSYVSVQQNPVEAPVKYSLDSALLARDRMSLNSQKRVSDVSGLGSQEYDAFEYSRQNQPSINTTNTKLTASSTPEGSSGMRMSARSGGSRMVPGERSSQWPGGPAVTSVMVRTVIPAPSWAVNTEATEGLSRASSKVTLPVVLQDQGERVSQRPNPNSFVLAASPASITWGNQQEVNVRALSVPNSNMISYSDAKGSVAVSAKVTGFRGTNEQTEAVTLIYNQQPVEDYNALNYASRETVEEVKEPPNHLVKLIMPPISEDHPEHRHYLDQANAKYYELPPIDSMADDSNAVYVVQADDTRTPKLSVKVPPQSESRPSLKRTETPWASPGPRTAHSTKDEIEAGGAGSRRASKNATARQPSTVSFKSAGKAGKVPGSAQGKTAHTTKVSVAVSNVSDAKPALRRRGTPWVPRRSSSLDDVLEVGAPSQRFSDLPSIKRTSPMPERGSSKGSAPGPQERASNNRHNLLPVPMAPQPPPPKRSTGSQVTPQSNTKPHNLQCVHNNRQGVGAIYQQCGCGPVRGCESCRWNLSAFTRLPPSSGPTAGYPVRRLCRSTDILGRHHGYCCQLPANPGTRQKSLYASDVRFRGANGSGSCGLYQGEQLPVQSNNEFHQCPSHDCFAVANDAVGQHDYNDKISPYIAAQITLKPGAPAAINRFVWRRCPGPWTRWNSNQDATHMGGDGVE
ncbi:unnamed protein product [Schistocephalus solidus]|uniref:Protein kinase domain-containing protein n=1 Tax=Schistocephalus solidus TaxID=70667 RepID=A0A183T6K9_SCHSO|nr:unnamed protein product [Schistocephalus solidus]